MRILAYPHQIRIDLLEFMIATWTSIPKQKEGKYVVVSKYTYVACISLSKKDWLARILGCHMNCYTMEKYLLREDWFIRILGCDMNLHTIAKEVSNLTLTRLGYF